MREQLPWKGPEWQEEHCKRGSRAFAAYQQAMADLLEIERNFFLGSTTQEWYDLRPIPVAIDQTSSHAFQVLWLVVPPLSPAGPGSGTSTPGWPCLSACRDDRPRASSCESPSPAPPGPRTPPTSPSSKAPPPVRPHQTPHRLMHLHPTPPPPRLHPHAHARRRTTHRCV
ncbi:hypothetical protein B0J18DRAFT_26081 [Chaetomium sp. MPI-SDFR-AT-0129]|nr:hypothetical protein B0J18DRAFT_26081 [Chaetomium sp. MPI-SDFR-AT-0129]